MTNFVTFYYRFKQECRYVPVEYCSPKQLVAMAIATGCIFVTCTKYGCKQFQNPIHPLNKV